MQNILNQMTMNHHYKDGFVLKAYHHTYAFGDVLP